MLQESSPNQDFLSITEIFASVQGETSYAGLPTTFIRLAACNLRCTWCDTAYSFGRGQKMAMQAIFTLVNSFGCQNICVTGGEPLLQSNVYPLMTTLCNQGFRVNLETGGSLPTTLVDPRVRIILDIKCPGSGMSDKNDWSNLAALRSHDEVKFVLLDRGDFDFAKSVCAQHNLFSKEMEILFSPVHGELNPQLLVSWILEDRLPVRLNLQIHKFIWTPGTQGV